MKKNDVAKMRQAGTAPAAGTTICCLSRLKTNWSKTTLHPLQMEASPFGIAVIKESSEAMMDASSGSSTPVL